MTENTHERDNDYVFTIREHVESDGTYTYSLRGSCCGIWHAVDPEQSEELHDILDDLAHRSHAFTDEERELYFQTPAGQEAQERKAELQKFLSSVFGEEAEVTKALFDNNVTGQEFDEILQKRIDEDKAQLTEVPDLGAANE